ncbi:MAG: hypothetical protein GXX96_20165 [Planctomycetaceae bacterium]|jgi:hypothetical protein|nr:hypothetical protein [Planctomycetaceae bacterium]
MNVHLAVMFDEPTTQDAEELRAAARALTDDRRSVRVSSEPERPQWLVAEFTMASQPQYAAVNRIDRCWEFRNLNRIDSAISFPKEAEPSGRRKRQARNG